MSISDRKREANRKNAQKSTGPKTKQGKEKASKNSVKHGLYCKDIIVKSKTFSENAEEYQLLLESLFDDLKPKGKLQEHLVTKISNCIWRSERLVRAETAHLNAQLDDIDSDVREAARQKKFCSGVDWNTVDTSLTPEEIERAIENGIGKRSIISDETGAFIHRFEMRLDRQMTRAYQMLRQLQHAQRDSLWRCNQSPTGGFEDKPTLVKNEETKPFEKSRVGSLGTMPNIVVGRTYQPPVACSSDSLTCPNHRGSDLLKNESEETNPFESCQASRPTAPSNCEPGCACREQEQESLRTLSFDHINASNIDEIIKNDPTIVPLSELKNYRE